MSEPETICCRPTRWFFFRALVMLLMFSVFAVLFFMDGATGYRKKNEVYYLHKAFQKANETFAKMNQDGALTPQDWQRYAASQVVELPADLTVLPAGFAVPMPWPDVLHDSERMKPLQWNILWREFTKTRGMDADAPEEPFDARKIKEQWVVFWVTLSLACTAAFFLVRTMRRSISADAEALTDQLGRRIPYADLKSLDLRKWETKGLAFIDFNGASGKGRIRIDGLTYGGFKTEEGEPAEKLVQFIRARFSGEIIEYATTAPAELAAPVADSGPKSA
jgi:hypothetical protein